MVFDLQVMGRLWLEAKAERERAEVKYKAISQQILDLLKQTGVEQVLVGDRVLFRVPYYRLSLKDKEEQAVQWLFDRGLLQPVAKISSGKLTQMLTRHPEQFVGIEQFVEVHSHERIASRGVSVPVRRQVVGEEEEAELQLFS